MEDEARRFSNSVFVMPQHNFTVSFTVLGYLTATLASMFIGSDASGQAGAAEPQDVADIKAELALLHRELQTLTERLTKPE